MWRKIYYLLEVCTKKKLLHTFVEVKTRKINSKTLFKNIFVLFHLSSKALE
jgi:hypothetical protein